MRNPLALLPPVQWSALRHADAFWPNLLLLFYILMSLVVSVLLMATTGWAGWCLGVFMMGHSLIVSAYLIHDLTHQTLFRHPGHNARLGRCLAFLTGACYGEYNELRRKHMRHHVERTDVVAVDYRAWLERHPLVRRIVESLEWCYIPAVDLIMHGLVMVAPFVFSDYRHLRVYTGTMLILRLSIFALLIVYQPAVAAGYAGAQLLMIHVLRLMDMHQHTYDVVYGSVEGHERPDAEYERQHTFSNPLGESVLANLLVLNFGYHNAHHERPTAPWYRLPALHRELAGPQEQTFALADVLRNLHRYRVARVMGGPDKTDGRPGFGGLYGVSFLTTL